ncbi:MAG: polysaccharide biosynthesis/export family protein [Cyanobacteria bacterium P01_A01_bin.37]
MKKLCDFSTSSVLVVSLLAIGALPSAAQVAEKSESTDLVANGQVADARTTSKETSSELELESENPVFDRLPTLDRTEEFEDPVNAASLDDYVLGGGDQIRIEIFNAPEINGDDTLYTVLVNGKVVLPWIGDVSVRGLSVQETGQAIAARYAEFLNEPVVNIRLVTPRPMRVAVVGEVNRPGAYTTGQGAGTGPSGTNEDQLRVGELRTVIEAIQTSGGITQLADVRNVQVSRVNANGSERMISVNLWALLMEGDLSQDMTLRDGDTVVVPTATSINLEESQAVAAASFSPDTIGVNVVGEVADPSLVSISPNSSLNQAILAAGGFDNQRARTGSVQLIRLNPNGTVTERTIEVDFSASLNEETNPIVRNNDIVIVSRSGLAGAFDFLDILGAAANAIINPVRGVVGIFDTLDEINDRRERRDDDDDNDDDFNNL